MSSGPSRGGGNRKFSKTSRLSNRLSRAGTSLHDWMSTSELYECGSIAVCAA